MLFKKIERTDSYHNQVPIELLNNKLNSDYSNICKSLRKDSLTLDSKALQDFILEKMVIS